MKIHQLVAGFADGDAISREARQIASLLRIGGYQCGIYAPAGAIGHNVAGQCLPLESLHVSADDILIFHYSIDSEASATFFGAKCRKIVRYHNITPAEYFTGFDHSVEVQLDTARRRLKDVAGAADRIVCVSEYNAFEVRDLGARNVDVVYLLDEYFHAQDNAEKPNIPPPDRNLKNILFVGRIAPNKCIEDLIEAFGHYHNCINRASRLLLVGSDRSCPKYHAVLKFIASKLELQNVTFCGFLDDASLSAHYRNADLFVSTSRHEGYCQPLIEAMINEVPVLARNCGGMPEAMDGAGVLYNDMPPAVLAEMMDRLVSDGDLRTSVLQAQEARVERLKARDLKADCFRLAGIK